MKGRMPRILVVTGMSGAGKSTALKALEDLGWETVDNLPLSLLTRLLRTERGDDKADERALAIGIDSRTRGFDAEALVGTIDTMHDAGNDIAILFLDCSGAELERRYAETRRRHPLALDRPAADGIARERELTAPLRQAAAHLIDTTAMTSNDLRLDVRSEFIDDRAAETALSVMSFGFARGLPRNADIVFDMRFLRNPHWVTDLRALTGLDTEVIAYIQADPAYETVITRIEDLLQRMIPRYEEEGKAYVTVALGCTGGRHRSVHLADRIARTLREAGFSPTVSHRDLDSQPDDSAEGVRTMLDVNGRSTETR